MSELPPKSVEFGSDDEKERRREELVLLSKELSEKDGFPFSGIERDSRLRLEDCDKKDPGFVTPIDELIKKFRGMGIKVVLGKNPESGDAFIVPRGSRNIIGDSILPKHLAVNEMMDKKLKELILKNRGY